MNRLPIELHPEAVEEALEARRWYGQRSRSAAEAFVAELEAAMEKISLAPERWSRYLHGTRRCLLKQFPYLVVYRETEHALQVIAIAHGKRKPGYWRRRAQKPRHPA